MFTVAEERPYAAVVSEEYADECCAGCLELTSNLIACEHCAHVAYCTPKCQRTDWRDVHQYECEVLQKQTEGRILTPMARLALRILILRYGTKIEDKPAFNGTRFDELEKNEKYVAGSKVYQKFLSDFNLVLCSVAKPLLTQFDQKWGSSLRDPAISGPIIRDIVCVCMANSFSVSDELSRNNVGTALYLGFSKHDHACSSTSHVIFEGGLAKLRSHERKYSKEITISYMSRVNDTWERQEELERVHFFKCKCSLCMDEEKNEKCMKLQSSGNRTSSHEGSSGDLQSKTKKIMRHYKKILKQLRSEKASVQKYLELSKEEPLQSLSNINSVMLELREDISFALLEQRNVSLSKPDMDKILRDSSCVDWIIEKVGLGRPETTRKLYALAAGWKLYSLDGIIEQAIISCKQSHGPGTILDDLLRFHVLYQSRILNP